MRLFGWYGHFMVLGWKYGHHGAGMVGRLADIACGTCKGFLAMILSPEEKRINLSMSHCSVVIKSWVIVG